MRIRIKLHVTAILTPHLIVRAAALEVAVLPRVFVFATGARVDILQDPAHYVDGLGVGVLPAVSGAEDLGGAVSRGGAGGDEIEEVVIDGGGAGWGADGVEVGRGGVEDGAHGGGEAEEGFWAGDGGAVGGEAAG
jgi:hypothetical protein